jgi:uncharacterized protein YdeI (YjbR/CyaY-like superfamily)
MELGKTLRAGSRKDWRAWLEKNHAREKEIWLVYYRKSSGKPRITYDDAVEEALAYGWIDSIQKGIDSERFAQRFTPRRPGSTLSEPNRQRILKLIKEKKMTPAGLSAVAGVFDKDVAKGEPLTISQDVLKAIKSDPAAWENFKGLPEGYKRIRIAFIEGRRRHGVEMFRKSLDHFVRMTAKNKRFGMMK